MNASQTSPSAFVHGRVWGIRTLAERPVCPSRVAALMRQAMPAMLYKKGDELGEGLHLNRWKVVKKIGEGQFAEVYEVVDAFKENKRVRKHSRPPLHLGSSNFVPPRCAEAASTAQCALKVERTLEAKTVKAEARVLKSLQSCSRVVRLVEQGSIDGRSFMVMEVRPGHAERLLFIKVMV